MICHPCLERVARCAGLGNPLRVLLSFPTRIHNESPERLVFQAIKTPCPEAVKADSPNKTRVETLIDGMPEPDFYEVVATRRK